MKTRLKIEFKWKKLYLRCFRNKRGLSIAFLCPQSCQSRCLQTLEQKPLPCHRHQIGNELQCSELKVLLITQTFSSFLVSFLMPFIASICCLLLWLKVGLGCFFLFMFFWLNDFSFYIFLKIVMFIWKKSELVFFKKRNDRHNYQIQF